VPGTKTWRGAARHVETKARERSSKKRRVDIFNQLVLKGFDGDAIGSMTRTFEKAKRFSVVRLVKVSDVDSTFNPTAVGAMRAFVWCV
jgi:hypothetical protein